MHLGVTSNAGSIVKTGYWVASMPEEEAVVHRNDYFPHNDDI